MAEWLQSFGDDVGQSDCCSGFEELVFWIK